jgi:hypothetical protein
MHTGPLVITTTTPSLWLNRPRDKCIYVYMTSEIDLVNLVPPRPYATRSHMYWYRSICYHNHNPQPLTESSTRLMYLRVYDNQDISRQPVPSPSLSYSFTHTHNTLPTLTLLTITWTQVLWFLESMVRPTVSWYVTISLGLGLLLGCMFTHTTQCIQNVRDSPCLSV